MLDIKSDKIFFQSIKTNICDITVYATDTAIIKINLTEFKTDNHKNNITEECCKQLTEYFQGMRKNFTVPIEVHSTEFQNNILNILQTVPYGCTVTYAQLAEKANKPKAARAVGNAVHNNPLPIIIPCHRVVSAKGIGGFALPIIIKQNLLELEKR